MSAVDTAASSKNKLDKLIHWFKLITITGTAQIIVQGVSLVSGIVIIRFLSTAEYALYTLVNTMLGTMTVLSDGGISAGVMAQGGKVWQDNTKLGVIMVTGLNLRKKFAIFSLIVAIPVLFYLLVQHGASWLQSTIIILSLIPAFIAALSDSLLEVGLKLRQDITSLQKNQVWVGIFRMILVFATFLAPFAAVGIITAGIPRILGNIKLKKLTAKYVDWNQKSDPEVRKEILAVVKRILPGAIYYCVSGQISIWLLSIFGNTNNIAQIGALSRLSMVLSLFNVLFSTLIIPRFSRLPDNKAVLTRYYFQLLIGVSVILLVVVGVSGVFPTQILWILGKSYSNLKNELFYSVIAACLSIMSGICFGLATSRGWVINPVISIPINILSIVFGALLFHVTTLTEVLHFNCFIALVQVLMHVLYTCYRLVKFDNVNY
ncbi:polysaccharide biosynthesis protein [Mucilaginibacter sp. RS28]|uniref:Polysaccharide biosynthesis protein n=1 Tax=Mucilaginibacter straminoryzae TaxID=2932774 RepID=A0A9X2B9Y5_9SPHI|nr:polysaccharide biosynthesis protein [Mucilaginibacter straminoryzae]MCJ8210240.1 polysaccharide biosynthesis protein [Mucilaginibacter straminoryzae]